MFKGVKFIHLGHWEAFWIERPTFKRYSRPHQENVDGIVAIRYSQVFIWVSSYSEKSAPFKQQGLPRCVSKESQSIAACFFLFQMLKRGRRSWAWRTCRSRSNFGRGTTHRLSTGSIIFCWFQMQMIRICAFLQHVRMQWILYDQLGWKLLSSCHTCNHLI